MLAAILILMTSAGAHAQTTTPSKPGIAPRRITTVPIGPNRTAAPVIPDAKPGSVRIVPIRPALQTPFQTADAMSRAERLSLQSDLTWVGNYNGTITGEVSERMVNSIKEYQKAKGGKPTGVLNPQERSVLAETARKKRESAGWKIVSEPMSGARLGIPGKLVPQFSTDASGSRWSSPTGTVQVILSRRREASPTMANLAEREKKEPTGRSVDYAVVKPDFFVLSGLQGLKKFYVRGTFQGDEARIMTILYDQATENVVGPVVIAMSSAFDAFPPEAEVVRPPRKTVEYGTGVVVSEDGAIVTDRAITDGCLAITVSGHGHADLLTEDKEHDLALLHIYGAQNLKPLSLSGGSATTNVGIVGIAHPQNQGGGSAVTSLTAALTPGSGGGSMLSPPPAVGFSGSAAIDGNGKFAGIALLKPAVVAGPIGWMASGQGVMVSAEIVRSFLSANHVTVDGHSLDAKAAVVRVICVRK